MNATTLLTCAVVALYLLTLVALGVAWHYWRRHAILADTLVHFLPYFRTVDVRECLRALQQQAECQQQANIYARLAVTKEAIYNDVGGLFDVVATHLRDSIAQLQRQFDEEPTEEHPFRPYRELSQEHADWEAVLQALYDSLGAYVPQQKGLIKHYQDQMGFLLRYLEEWQQGDGTVRGDPEDHFDFLIGVLASSAGMSQIASQIHYERHHGKQDKKGTARVTSINLYLRAAPDRSK